MQNHVRHQHIQPLCWRHEEEVDNRRESRQGTAYGIEISVLIYLRTFLTFDTTLIHKLRSLQTRPESRLCLWITFIRRYNFADRVLKVSFIDCPLLIVNDDIECPLSIELWRWGSELTTSTGIWDWDRKRLFGVKWRIFFRQQEEFLYKFVWSLPTKLHLLQWEYSN